MTYKDLYENVIESGKYRTRMERIKALAQLIFTTRFDDVESQEDAVWAALERYEDMTGCFCDPTQEEFDDIVRSII